MEFQAARFYDKAAECTTDVGVRRLFGDSLLRKGATKTEQLNSKKSFSLRRQEKKRKRPGGVCLCCNMCSLASPD